MREIKFRAWGKEEMLYHTIPNSCNYLNNAILDVNGKYNYKLMQYTGLKDKNNKEIYEGDILDTDLERPYLVVEFRNGCFVVECRDDNEKYYDIMHPLEKEISNLEYHEVIGNTYENPELLR